jgi:hypothetical protein
VKQIPNRKKLENKILKVIIQFFIFMSCITSQKANYRYSRNKQKCTTIIKVIIIIYYNDLTEEVYKFHSSRNNSWTRIEPELTIHPSPSTFSFILLLAEIGPKQFRVKPEVTAGYNRTRTLSIHRHRLNKQKNLRTFVRVKNCIKLEGLSQHRYPL